MPLRAVIFDGDGTLVDSVEQHAKAWRQAFAEFSHDISFDEIRRQIGKGGDQLIPVFLDEAERTRIGATLEKRRGAIVRETYLDTIQGFPKVRELLERIIADGKSVALASSSKAEEIAVYKRAAHIDDLVRIETSADDADRSKPHPDIFPAALERLDGLSPDQIIVVGDTPYDAEAAAKAGLRTIGLLCGGFPEHDLRKAGCIAIYRDPAHLLADYERSPIAA